MMLSDLGCFKQDYDLRLVLLAAFICVMASFTTVNLLSRAQQTDGGRKFVWLAVAAAIFGSGVWALHFVAMLAFMPTMPIYYDVHNSARSIVSAIVGAALAFAALECGARRKSGAIAGAVLLTAGVTAMHYDGVGGMRLPGEILLDPSRVGISVAVGLAFAALAFMRASGLESIWRKIEVSGYLGLAVIGLHFVGMSAITVIPGLRITFDGAVLGSGSLAVVVGSISVAIIVIGMAGALTDQRLTKQVQLEAHRLRQLADASFEGIMIHQNGVIRDVNDMFAAMAGRDAKDLIGRSALDFVASRDLTRVKRHLEEGKDGGRMEFEVTGPGGVAVPVEVLSRRIEYGGAAIYVSAVRDLSERKRAEEKIVYLAHHDVLTGLCNRAALSDRLAQAISAAERDREKIAVLYLDLDRFKPINDLLGHEAGDRLLVAVTQRLRSMVRAADTIARVGGDEFVIVQAIGEDDELAAVSAERVISALSAPFLLDGEAMTIGVSVGIALFPEDGKTAADLLRNADKAMYRAKRDTRGAFRSFSPELDRRLVRRRLAEQDLRHAIGRGEMQLYYQPIFDANKNLVAAEALLRWNHAKRGMISPAEFIPIAEECGFISELGSWVLETACADAIAWPSHLRIAVNVSPAQFSEGCFSEEVTRILRRAGLEPGRLELEVTESLLIGDAGKVLPLLNALRRSGVHLALDDFGTGYSSLNYLNKFPFDKLKIDRSFIANLAQAGDAAKITGAIVALGQSLQMTVTAEGVETQAQFDALHRLGCDQMQGYLLGRPMPKSDFDRLFEPRAIRPATANNPRFGAGREDRGALAAGCAMAPCQ